MQIPSQDVYPGSEFFLSRIQDPGSRFKKILDPGSAFKNLSILTQKIVPKLSEIWTGLFIPDPEFDFLPIPDPGVKKAPDSGSGSATLLTSVLSRRWTAERHCSVWRGKRCGRGGSEGGRHAQHTEVSEERPGGQGPRTPQGLQVRSARCSGKFLDNPDLLIIFVPERVLCALLYVAVDF